ncbi:Homoserine O-acetyltransferase [Flagellimonas maritima]|uniref:Homoserine O-acetyltransferase n=1 Tax=Flagellimonas maritima TaxID=1383885 RepID=A0A2Z4LVW8_9FLAO|nr:alpha/beta hydrolase [Allomuricauda aurantiaca]AWX45956.1 Homoserine O-acetyltransferase [Allomuricauda aurantiaca]
MIVKTKIGTIEYSDLGKGKPILFLHGGHSNCDETLWHKGFDLDEFKLITPSRPGYGKTPLSTFESPKEAAGLVISLLDKIKIEKVVVIGISAGGLTALELAANYKDRVKKLILLSAVTKKWLQPSDALYRKGKILFSPAMEKFTWTMFRIFFKLTPLTMTKTLFKELSTVKGASFDRKEIETIKEMTSKQSSGNGFVNDLEQDITSGTHLKIECPTLIVHSKNDKTVSIAMAYHAKKNILCSQLKLYNNKWGHLLWVGTDSTEPITETLIFINKAQNQIYRP